MKTKQFSLTLFIIAYSTIIYSQTTLTLLNSHSISDDVEEPSGLAFDILNNQLFCVSHSDDIYRLSTTGNLLETYDFSGDLEGVSMYKASNTLLVAIEVLIKL